MEMRLSMGVDMLLLDFNGTMMICIEGIGTGLPADFTIIQFWGYGYGYTNLGCT